MFAGAISGFASIWICSGLPDWNLAGVIFLAAMTLSTAVCQLYGWLSFQLSTWRCIIAASLIASLPPFALWTEQLIEISYGLVCGIFEKNEICRHQATSGWPAFLIPA